MHPPPRHLLLSIALSFSLVCTFRVGCRTIPGRSHHASAANHMVRSLRTITQESGNDKADVVLGIYGEAERLWGNGKVEKVKKVVAGEVMTDDVVARAGADAIQFNPFILLKNASKSRGKADIQDTGNSDKRGVLDFDPSTTSLIDINSTVFESTPNRTEYDLAEDLMTSAAAEVTESIAVYVNKTGAEVVGSKNPTVSKSEPDYEDLDDTRHASELHRKIRTSIESNSETISARRRERRQGSRGPEQAHCRHVCSWCLRYITLEISGACTGQCRRGAGNEYATCRLLLDKYMRTSGRR